MCGKKLKILSYFTQWDYGSLTIWGGDRLLKVESFIASNPFSFCVFCCWLPLFFLVRSADCYWLATIFIKFWRSLFIYVVTFVWISVKILGEWMWLPTKFAVWLDVFSLFCDSKHGLYNDCHVNMYTLNLYLLKKTSAVWFRSLTLLVCISVFLLHLLQSTLLPRSCVEHKYFHLIFLSPRSRGVNVPQAVLIFILKIKELMKVMHKNGSFHLYALPTYLGTGSFAKIHLNWQDLFQILVSNGLCY